MLWLITTVKWNKNDDTCCVLLPAVSSLVVAQEQEAAQVKGQNLCQVVFLCPGVCVWAGRWSPPLAVCCCNADWRLQVFGRTWLQTERCRTNTPAGTDGLHTETDRWTETDRFGPWGAFLHCMCSRSSSTDWWGDSVRSFMASGPPCVSLRL